MGFLGDFNNLQFDLSKYIKSYIEQHGGFVSRSYYSETFSLNLLYRNDMLCDNIKTKLLLAYENFNMDDPEFHWEFNNYALIDYLHISNDQSVLKFLSPLRFKNTSCTNWTLLRSAVRLKAQQERKVAIKEAKGKIRRFQRSTGLILDDPGVKSFQYHCFSLAMIVEIYEQTDNSFFADSFFKGVEFIRHFILSNGETLYIGRGQNQSFGYGTLLYVLAMSYKYTHDKTLLGDIEKIYRFLIQFRNSDGSFPLVMNKANSTIIPNIINTKDTGYAGWYPYNNYFDYLSFMGYFIAKATNILSRQNLTQITYRRPHDYRDKDFIKIGKYHNNYEAIISKPGGYWTNDMPIPFIITKGKSITPMYGGEQFQSSLYRVEGLPLPFSEKLKKSIRWKSISFLRGNTLWLISLLGIMKRSYVFKKDLIHVTTRVFSIFSFKHIYLFLENGDRICANLPELEFEGFEYSASGKLKKYITRQKLSVITIKVDQ